MGLLSDLFNRNRVPVAHGEDVVRRYFDAVRGTYVGALTQGLRELLEHTEGELLVEPTMDSESPMAGLGLPWRADAVEIDADGGGESIRLTGVEYDLAWAADAYAFKGGLVAHVEPFAWDACTIVGTPTPPDAARERLVRWFSEWFEPQEGYKSESHLGVVHSLSEPELRAGYIRLQVDLGTAPAEALVDLLGTLGDIGVRDALVYTPPQPLIPAPAQPPLAN